MLIIHGEPDTLRGVRPVRREGAENLLVRAQASDSLLYVSEVFSNPLHPYTRGLIQSTPENGFHPISGISPALSELPAGCVFHPRCAQAMQTCKKQIPDLKYSTKSENEAEDNSTNHMVRCLC